MFFINISFYKFFLSYSLKNKFSIIKIKNALLINGFVKLLKNIKSVLRIKIFINVFYFNF